MPIPSLSELVRISPTKQANRSNAGPSVKTIDPDMCRICDIEFESQADIDTNLPWIGCVVKGCNYWIHSHCKGFPGMTE